VHRLQRVYLVDAGSLRDVKKIFPFDVFLNHSSKDKTVVRSVAERLRSDGLNVWFDEWEIKPGDSIPAKIEEGLEQSRVLVLCMSANAFGSDWAQLEADTFRFRDPLNRERLFIPLRLDDAPVKGSLAQFLYINWCSEDREGEYAKLLAACRKLENWPVHSTNNSWLKQPQRVVPNHPGTALKGSSLTPPPTYTTAKTRNNMPVQQFNADRKVQLEELLDIEYERLHEFEKAISLTDGISQKIALRQQIKRELTPRLRELEQEYASLLASSVTIAEISAPEADDLVAELSAAAERAQENTQGRAPAEMVRLLKEIREKLDEPGKSAAAKLKLTLPIVPLLASYEMEMDTEAVVTQVWRKVRDFFKGFLARPL
jgi:hypothetical protein